MCSCAKVAGEYVEVTMQLTVKITTQYISNVFLSLSNWKNEPR